MNKYKIKGNDINEIIDGDYFKINQENQNRNLVRYVYCCNTFKRYFCF